MENMVFFISKDINNAGFKPSFDVSLNDGYSTNQLDFVLECDGIEHRYEWHALLNDGVKVCVAFDAYLYEPKIVREGSDLIGFVPLTEDHSTIAEMAKDLFCKLNSN